MACSSDIMVGTPAVTTSCTLTSAVVSVGPVLAMGLADCPGSTYSILYTVTDACSRSASCTQVFTIVNAAPSIVCPANAIVDCSSDIMVGTPAVTTSCTLTSAVVSVGPVLAMGLADCPGSTYSILYTAVSYTHLTLPTTPYV